MAEFLMIFSWNSLIFGQCIQGGGWEGYGVGWVVAKAKTKKQYNTMVEFRVAMTSTCTHKGPIFHYKA